MAQKCGFRLGDKESSSLVVWEFVVQNRLALTSREFSALSRFKARFDFAHNLRSFSTLGISKPTEEAYFVLMKLGLAYSAVEALQLALGKGRNFKLEVSTLRAFVAAGELDALIKHLLAAAKQQKRDNSSELTVFLEPDCPSDLLPLVKHSRHVMFHGSATPNSLKLAGSKRRRQLILDLAIATLAMTEMELQKWLKTVVASRNLEA